MAKIPSNFRSTYYNFFRWGFILLVFLSLWQPFNLLRLHGQDFTKKGYQELYPELKKAYYSSQYVNKINPGIMPDNTFESFVGGAFLKGTNPILIVHEHPPMGRYIIGLSILLFDNAATLIIPCLFLSLLGIFLIAKLVLQNNFLSLIPVAIFANEPLFFSKFIYAPLLEPIQLMFIIYTIYFFIRGMMSKHAFLWFILSSVMLGFVISIRFFILGAFLTLSLITSFISTKKIAVKHLLQYIVSLPISIVVLLLAYTKTIQDGYSILQIFGVQKYIFFYHNSKIIEPFTFWDLILFNRWHTWWADRQIISDSVWNPFWPVVLVLVSLYIIAVVLRKMQFSLSEKIILCWVISYCVLLSIGTSTTRYFLPLVPFLYILSVSFLVKLTRLIEKQLSKK